MLGLFFNDTMAKGRRKRKSSSVSDVTTQICEHCEKAIPIQKFTRHLGQCRSKAIEEESRQSQDKQRNDEYEWVDTPLDDDEDNGDLGFLGPDDEEAEDEDLKDCPPDMVPVPVSDPRNMEIRVTKMDGKWMKYVQGGDESEHSDLDPEDYPEDESEDELAEVEAERNVGDDERNTDSGQVVPPFGRTTESAQQEEDERENDVLFRHHETTLEYENLTTKGHYNLVSEWCGTAGLEDLEASTPLARVLSHDQDCETMGRCYYRDPKTEVPVKILDDSDMGVLRLVEYCQRVSSSQNRGFVDGFLDLLVDLMDNHGFDPRLRKKRETVTKKVMKDFGQGCEPTITSLSVATEDRLVVLQEEALKADRDAPHKTGSFHRCVHCHGHENHDQGFVTGNHCCCSKCGGRMHPFCGHSNLLDQAPACKICRGCAPLVGLTEDQIQQADGYKATPQQIVNRERHVVEVISFSARNMILDLLSDTNVFGDLDNLVVNRTNPFLPYENPTGISDEMLDGSWYKDTIARLKDHAEDPLVEDMEFVLPLVMYVDKTGTSINQRYPLEPFIFTTAIIRRSLRNLPSSWRPLGFIPDLEAKSSAEKSFINSSNKGHTAQGYHYALEKLLEGVRDVQDRGIIHWLQLGNYVKRVRIRPEVACIINDGKSADMLTLRVPSFHASRRVSRCCNTLQAECDQVTKECSYLCLNKKVEELFGWWVCRKWRSKRTVAMLTKPAGNEQKLKQKSYWRKQRDS